MNDEIRMTNDESNPNAQMTNVRNGFDRARLDHLNNRHSNLTRHSSFVIRHSRNRGSAFVATVWIITAIAGLMLVMADSVRVETLASANRLSQAQADAAEKGAEQFVLSAVDAEVASPGSVTSPTAGVNMEALSIGDAYVWIIKPDPDDETAISFGLTDEASKLDLNSATSAQLQLLPNMTAQNGDCIVDWRDADSTPGPQGAEDPSYQAPDDGSPPRHCKNAPFETVEELLLVISITPDLLWGQDTTRSGHASQTDNPMMSATIAPGSSVSDRGIFPFVTCYGKKASTTPPASKSNSLTSGTITGGGSSAPVDVNNVNPAGLTRVLQQYLGGSANEILRLTQDRLANRQPFTNIWDWAISVNLTSDQFSKVFAHVTVAPPSNTSGSGAVTVATVPKINVNSAPEQVLMTITGFDQSDADAIIAHRQTNPDPQDPTDISWLLDAVPKNKLRIAGYFVTGMSYCYSADILTCSHDGRAFKRMRIVVDASTGTSQIIYRRDMTAFGWPLDPQVRADLRAGKQIATNNGFMGGMIP